MGEEVEPFISIREIGKRIQWLILLRWIASVCLFATITATHFLLKISFDLLMLYVGNAALVCLNVVYSVHLRRLAPSGVNVHMQKKLEILINVQISLDLTLLSYLIHFAGGVVNPFVVFYIFHMVIASILLSNRDAYLQATYASLVFSGVAIAGHFGLFQRRQLSIIYQTEQTLLESYRAFGVVFALVSGMYIVVYMSTTIVNKLREREREIESARYKLLRINAQLEKKDFEKSRYVQILTHDIKGALSSIQICLRVVLEGFTGDVSEKSIEMISRSEKRSEILLHMAKDLHYLSVLRTTDKIEISRIQISDWVNSKMAEWSTKFREKHINLLIGTESSAAHIHANTSLLAKAIELLLDNADRYTPRGGSVTINVDDVDPVNGVKISIDDNGIGICNDDAERIFEDFYRAHIPENEHTDCPGLGLPVVKTIVELFGGSVSLVSELKVGSSFILEFPAHNMEEEE